MTTARDRKGVHSVFSLGSFAAALALSLGVGVLGGCDGGASADAGKPAPQQREGGHQVVQTALASPPEEPEDTTTGEPTEPTPKEASEGPQITFEKTFHDFGTIDDSQPVTMEFKFRNTGKAPLEIIKVNSSCGCTAATPTKTMYEPGEEGAITVTFKPMGRNGEQHKSIRVETNDPQERTAMLKISADVLAAVTVSPRIINFGNVERGQERAERFEVRLRGGESVVESVDVEGGNMTAQIIDRQPSNPADQHPASLTTVEVVLHDDAPLGWLERKVHLKTTMNDQPQIDVLCTGTVLGMVEVQPVRLTLGVVRSGVAFQREMRLVHRRGDLFKLVEAKVECEKDAQMVVKPIGEIGEDGVAILRLQVMGVGPEEGGEIKGDIILTTSVEGEGPIRVPFNGVVRPQR